MPTTPQFESAITQLNIRQKEAVTTLDGPVLVLAGPGTGKTEVLAVRVGNILTQTDMQSSNILCLTFSNAGVRAMKKRLQELLGTSGADIKVETYHSFGLSIVKNYAKSENPKTILNDAYRYMVLEKILENKKLAGHYFEDKPTSDIRLKSLSSIFKTFKKECITVTKMEELVNYCIEELLPLEKHLFKRNGEFNVAGRKIFADLQKFSQTIAPMFQRYNEILAQHNRYDFEDMLDEAIKLFNDDPSRLLDYQEKFQYILVDEFQDTNEKQLELLKTLIKGVEKPNLFIVGDDDQCIYKFQGANQRNFETIINLLPETKTIVLDTNYRSTITLLQSSYNLIQPNNNRNLLKCAPLIQGISTSAEVNQKKPTIISYENEEQEAYSIVESVNALLQKPNYSSQVAILYKTKADSKPLEKWLDNFGITYRKGASSANLLETEYGKKIYYALQIIKLLEKEPALASDYFCNLLLEFGIEKQLLKCFLTWKKSKSDTPFIKWLEVNKVDIEVIELLQHIREISINSEEIISTTFLEKFNVLISNFGKCKPDQYLITAWAEFVEEFIESDKKKSFVSLADLLQYYEIQDLPIRYDLPEDKSVKVILSTIWGSKGLEYDTVYIKGCQSRSWEKFKGSNNQLKVPEYLNKFINDQGDNIEDFRRLIYVAATRAKYNLHISYCRKNNTGSDNKISDLLTPIIEISSITVLDKPIFELPKVNAKFQFEVDTELNELIQEKIKGFCISPSSLINWLEDPYKFFMQNICKLPDLPAKALTFGSFIHTILERISDNIESQHLVQRISEIAAQEYPNYQYEFHYSHADKYKKHASNIVFKYFEKYPLSKTPFAKEQFYTITMSNGVRLNGYIDRIDIEDATAFLIDYKSGYKYGIPKLEVFVDENKPGNHYWRQAMIYYYLVKANLQNIDIIDVSFHYVEKLEIIKLNYQENIEFDNWLLKIWGQIQNFKLN